MSRAESVQREPALPRPMLCFEPVTGAIFSVSDILSSSGFIVRVCSYRNRRCRAIILPIALAPVQLIRLKETDKLPDGGGVKFAVDHAACSVEPLNGVSKGGEHPLCDIIIGAGVNTPAAKWPRL